MKIGQQSSSNSSLTTITDMEMFTKEESPTQTSDKDVSNDMDVPSDMDDSSKEASPTSASSMEVPSEEKLPIQNTHSTSFMDLPIELRLKIYSIYLSSEVVLSIFEKGLPSLFKIHPKFTKELYETQPLRSTNTLPSDQKSRLPAEHVNSIEGKVRRFKKVKGRKGIQIIVIPDMAWGSLALGSAAREAQDLLQAGVNVMLARGPVVQ